MITEKITYIKCPLCGNKNVRRKESECCCGDWWIYETCETEGCSYCDFSEGW